MRTTLETTMDFVTTQFKVTLIEMLREQVEMSWNFLMGLFIDLVIYVSNDSGS